MSLPEDLIRWSEARALVAGRGYPVAELFGDYKAGLFPAYTPYRHDNPMPYDIASGGEARSDEWFENWLWKEVHIDRSFVESRWPQKAGRDGGHDPVGRRGGRPAQYDWAKLSAYIAAYLVENDYPQTQAGMERVVQNWFQTVNDRPPDESTIRKWVKSLYDSRELMNRR